MKPKGKFLIIPKGQHQHKRWPPKLVGNDHVTRQGLAKHRCGPGQIMRKWDCGNVCAQGTISTYIALPLGFSPSAPDWVLVGFGPCAQHRPFVCLRYIHQASQDLVGA